jgi:hypothetical protein
MEHIECHDLQAINVRVCWSPYAEFAAHSARAGAKTNLEPRITNSELGTEREHEPRTEKLGTVNAAFNT